ncbi:MAG TPA: class II aldolase/adducin family protein [Bryobacteraceae bacterium]|nr:class II aldolase/adducin family protein [Bryobacteraceae bacterium]
MKIRTLIAGSVLLLLAGGVAFEQSAQKAPASGASAQSIVEELALANRMLSEEGVLDAYGHVSVRDPRNPNRFYLARHMPAGLVTPSDVIQYDLDSKALSGDPNAGYTERFIHGEIYKVRPDVMAVVHDHAPELVAFGVSATPLRPISHMGGFIGQDVPVFDIRAAAGDTDMLIRNNQLGRALAASLGNHTVALMRGHGAVIVAPSLHVVVGRAYYLSFNARVQQSAMALGGKLTYLSPEEAKRSSAQDGYERAWSLFAAKAKAR